MGFRAWESVRQSDVTINTTDGMMEKKSLFELDAEVKIMFLVQLEEVVLSNRGGHLVD
jgi:hypothetical protein